MNEDEVKAAVERIEREHREEVVRIYAGAGAVALLGIPIAIGAVALLLHLIDNRMIELADIGRAIGPLVAVGAVLALVYWAALKIWARL